MQWLAAIRTLAGAHVTAVRERWVARRRPGSVHTAVDEILAADTRDAQSSAVTAATDAAREATAADPRWRHLVATLGLDAREVEWLAVLAACELTPRLTRVLGYLDDAVTPAPPTPATAAVLWDWPIGYQPGPASSLARWQLAAPLEDAWHSTSPWTIDADVAAYLAGREDWAEMRRAARLLDVGGLDCLHPGLLAQMRDTIAGVDGMGCEVELVGHPVRDAAPCSASSPLRSAAVRRWSPTARASAGYGQCGCSTPRRSGSATTS